MPAAIAGAKAGAGNCSGQRLIPLAFRDGGSFHFDYFDRRMSKQVVDMPVEFLMV